MHVWCVCMVVVVVVGVEVVVGVVGVGVLRPSAGCLPPVRVVAVAGALCSKCRALPSRAVRGRAPPHAACMPHAAGPRPYGASMMQLMAAKWLNKTFPYMQRRGGRDHIWLMAHDEGACYVHRDVWPGVMLSHWGRMDKGHISNSQVRAAAVRACEGI